ncbi:MAG: UDP-N-acetylmuramoyl-tripeptide--D-alanyl-D-alanine ligase [Clostridia bacterium]|nr:UDP-N-acetylmuramoyl-tripeptide--D-alanyl-D-alanine ligase [Clostridia bacterium]
MNLNTLSEALAEKQLFGNGQREITGYSIDSRTIEAGHLFFALPGEQVDGHRFVGEALAKGASGAVVSRLPQGLDPYLARAGLIVVPGVLQALQQLATAMRLKAGIPVVAVTGSNGKTTTKDLIAAVLGSQYSTLKTEGNFNNELGLPLTLLSLKESHRIAVLEMGMRGLGQIRELCRIARPDYGVITNIGTAHYELLGSQENIAKAKGELPHSLPDKGTAILNRDDPWCFRLGVELKQKRPDLSIIYYGFHQSAWVRATGLEHLNTGVGFQVVWEGKSYQAYLPLPGAHNVQNALAAIAVGLINDISLKTCIDGLARVVVSEKRLAQVAGMNGSTIIDDTYNANPGSVVASLEVLASAAGKRKIAVLGTQRELGALAEKGHRNVGAKVADLEIDLLLTVGVEAQWMADEALRQGMEAKQVYSLNNNQEAIQMLQQLLRPGDVVLVKGSRALAMEEIVRGVTG